MLGPEFVGITSHCQGKYLCMKISLLYSILLINTLNNGNSTHSKAFSTLIECWSIPNKCTVHLSVCPKSCTACAFLSSKGLHDKVLPQIHRNAYKASHLLLPSPQLPPVSALQLLLQNSYPHITWNRKESSLVVSVAKPFSIKET